MIRLALLLAFILALPAHADQLTVDGAHATYRLDQDLPKPATLTLDWTDTAGRLVDRQTRPVSRAGTIGIDFDFARAVVPGNTLTARLPGSPTLTASLPAPPRTDPWTDWQTMIFQSRTPAQLHALHTIGLTGAMLFGSRTDPVQIDAPAAMALLFAQGLRGYIENIATDYYAEYHRYRPGQTEAASLDVARARQRAGDPAAFIRDPGLSDPAWAQRIHDRLTATVRAYAPYRPLYYSLADEPGIADLAAAWDFDFAPASLAAFRAWLPTQYPSLAALNQQWATHFPTWDSVFPDTTDAAMLRPGDDFAAWSDFKEWMDLSFATAVRAGTDAIHAADPHALSAIEGGQIPGWGGYDYARLAPALDVMEIYDFGQNVDMARSFNPAIILLSTLSGHTPAQLHALWRSALTGTRGVVLWDEADDLASPDGTLAEGGRALRPTIEALHDGLGALLIAATPAPPRVAILASPASFRVEWMLDQRHAGPAWVSRDAEAEYADTPMRAATRGFAHLLGHLGVQPHFVSPAMLTDGTLDREDDRVLILPHTLTLSDEEAAAIELFAASGRLVVSDIIPGTFDGHGRRRPAPALDWLFSRYTAPFPLGDGARADAGDGRDRDALDRLASILRQSGAAPAFHLLDANGETVRDVTGFVRRLGTTTVVMLQPDAGSPTRKVTLVLDAPRVITPPAPMASMQADRIDLVLDPVTPTWVTLTDRPAAAPSLSAAAAPRAGVTLPVMITVANGTGAMLHVDVTAPDGTARPYYAGNVAAFAGTATWPVPLALDDPPGVWTFTATDVATGLAGSIAIPVGEAR